MLIGRAELLGDIHAALRDADGGALVLHGPPGIGKSALLRALLAQATDSDRNVLEVRATASADLPYAALLDLVPAGAAEPVPELLRASLARQATDAGPAIVVVDDLQALDEASIGLLEDAVTRGAVVGLMACRTGDSDERELRARTASWPARWIEVPPLGPEPAGAFAESIVGSRIGQATRVQLHSRTGGNPLLLQETLHAALQSGALYPDPDGTLRARVALPVTDSLIATVQGRLRSLSSRVRHAAELLALGQPLHPDVLRSAAVDQGIVASLHEAGILRTDRHGLWLDHPLHAEIVLEDLPDERRRRHLRRILDAIPADAPRDRVLEVRLTAWERELGGRVSIDARLRAARTAMIVGEFDLADDLIGDLDLAAAGLIRAELAATRGAPSLALEQLEDLHAASENDRAHIEMLRSRIHLIALGRPDVAATVLARIDTARLDPILVSELHAAQALVLLLSGRTREAADIVRLLTASTPASAQVATLVSTSIAEMLLGDLSRAEAQADLGLDLLSSLEQPGLLPFSEVQLGCSRVYAQLYSGRIEDALAQCRRSQEEHLRRGGAVAGLWTSMRGHAELLAGNLRTARAVASDAVAMTRREDPLGHGGLTLADQALATLLLGDLEDAAILLEELEARPDAAGPRVAVNLARVRAWFAATAGDPEQGARTALDGAKAANAAGYHTWALFAAHDAVRIGGHRQAVAAAEVMETGRHGLQHAPLLEDLVRHTHALIQDDVAELTDVARRLRQAGADLHAAEVYHQASAAARRLGNPRGAMRLRRAAAAAFPGEAWTVGTVHELPSLTPREREIAELARSGHSNHTIAARLSVSVRTVENHLTSVYSKLGIVGRRDLGQVLAGAITS